MEKSKKVGYCIDREIADEFDKYCDINSINKSKWIENKIRELLDKRKS